MILKTIRQLFRKKENGYSTRNNPLKTRSSYISFWTAGLNFDSRKDSVLKCRLNERVFLKRELKNVNDINAIHVRRRDGSSLGYVGKYRAAKLAPLIDNSEINLEATIVDLKCDLLEEIYGVKVAMYVEPQVAELLSDDKEEIDFLFDYSSSGNLYLLIDSQESTFDQIIKLFDKIGLNIIRSGISYRPGTNGKMYSWYLSLEDNVDKALIETNLRHSFPVLNEKYERKIDEEYVELQEEEIVDLKTLNSNFRDQIKRLNKSNQKLIRMNGVFSNQFKNIINLILPDVEFLGGSMDILENEIEDYSGPLKKIIRLKVDPNIKGKKVITLSKWWELHFNSGQRDDGRLYFKRVGRKYLILVSFKKNQKKDILFLRKY